MKKVLVVDDAAFMRITLKNMMTRNGYEIIGEAANGIEAVKKYVELRPDIVTMDITMPEQNGVQALKDIKKIDPDANVIMISAMGQETMVKEAVLSGAFGFLVKPFKEEAVLKALSKVK